MKTKIIGILVIMLLIATVFSGVSGKPFIENNNEKNKSSNPTPRLVRPLPLPPWLYSIINPDWNSWDNTPDMYAIPEGNVGIGVSSPTEKLQVEGIIHSTSGGFKFPDGTVQTTASTGGGSCYWMQSGNNIYYNEGNVGIGTTSPDEELEVDGDTMVSGNYKYSSDKTYYLNIPDAEFVTLQRITEDHEYIHSINGYGYILAYDITTDVKLICPVHLPDGAIVTEFRTYCYDYSFEDLAISATLFRRAVNSTSREEMAQISFITNDIYSIDILQNYSNTINSPTINNENYQYYIYVDYDQTYCYDDDMRWYGCRIEYTMDTIRP